MIDPSLVTAVVITRGDLPVEIEVLRRQHERVGMQSVIVESPDILTRYTTAERHAGDIVFFQDDDVLLPDEALIALCALYQPGILVSNMYDEWIESMGYTDLAMVGLGAICDNGLWADAFDRFEAAYAGEDGWNRLAWDADFIFGVLAKWRRFDLTGPAVILDAASADNRLWRKPGQHERKYESINMARELRTVALTMMTRNEEKNIRRALESSKTWWDKLLLFDGESNDLTVAIASEFCEAEGKEFYIFPQVEGHFRERRQQMIETGRQYADYMLLQDADEEWANAPERPLLIAEAYMLHYEGSIDYAQPRLIASRFPWKWSGVTHAYLDSDWEGECLAVNMPLPLIIHHGDNRHGTTKAEHDVELLLAEIKRTDDDLPRNLFLLAKAYDGLGDWDKALEFYGRRVAASLNDEEGYWSLFRLGCIRAEHKGDFAQAVRTLWRAYKSRPQRVEALRALAFYCTAVADATPYPEDDISLVMRDQYRVSA